MKMAILIVHLIVALSLIGLILMQTSKGGLGSAFGGGEFYRTRRGAEKIVLYATFAAAVLFLITSIFTMIVG